MIKFLHNKYLKQTVFAISFSCFALWILSVIPNFVSIPYVEGIGLDEIFSGRFMTTTAQIIKIFLYSFGTSIPILLSFLIVLLLENRGMGIVMKRIISVFFIFVLNFLYPIFFIPSMISGDCGTWGIGCALGAALWYIGITNLIGNSCFLYFSNPKYFKELLGLN